MNMKLFVLLVGLVFLVACGGSQAAVEEAPAAEEAEPEEEAEVEEEAAESVPVTDASMLVGGTWFSGARQGAYIQFNADGTYIGAFEKERIPDAPDMQGEYRFEDGVFIIEDRAYSEFVAQCPGIIGSYTVEMRDNGRLYFTTVEDTCEPRVRGLATVLGHHRLDS